MRERARVTYDASVARDAVVPLAVVVTAGVVEVEVRLPPARLAGCATTERRVLRSRVVCDDTQTHTVRMRVSK